MTGYTCCFGLDSLCTAYFQPLGSSIGIKCHILCLKRCRVITILTEDAAKGSGYNAFSYITTGSGKHNWMKFLHIYFFSGNKITFLESIAADSSPPTV